MKIRLEAASGGHLVKVLNISMHGDSKIFPGNLCYCWITLKCDKTADNWDLMSFMSLNKSFGKVGQDGVNLDRVGRISIGDVA